MVTLKLGFEPVILSGVSIFLSAFFLGGLMQRWVGAILNPLPDTNSTAIYQQGSGKSAIISNEPKSVILSDSKEVVYLIIGFLHFGGMLAGAAIALLAVLSQIFVGQPVRVFAILVAAPVAFFGTCAFWVLYTLPSFKTFVLDSERFDQFWFLWLLGIAGLLLAAWIRLAYDAFS